MKTKRWEAQLSRAEQAELATSPTVALLFRRAAILTDESALMHPRRGRDHSRPSAIDERDKLKYGFLRNKPESSAGPAQSATMQHTSAALQHARTCNEVVRQLLEMQRMSVTEDGLRDRHRSSAVPIGQRLQPESASLMPGTIRTAEVVAPFFFRSTQWSLLIELLRSLPGELVEETTIDALWGAISTAHMKPELWDTLVADQMETDLSVEAKRSTRKRNLRAFLPFTPHAALCNKIMSLYIGRQSTQHTSAASPIDVSKPIMIWFWMREHAVTPMVTTIQLLLRHINWRISHKLRAGAVAGLQKASALPVQRSPSHSLDVAEAAHLAEVLSQPASMEEIAELGRLRSGKFGRQLAAAVTAATATTAPAAAPPTNASSSRSVTPSIQVERQLFEEIWVVWESICRGTDPVTATRLAADAAERARITKEKEERWARMEEMQRQQRTGQVTVVETKDDAQASSPQQSSGDAQVSEQAAAAEEEDQEEEDDEDDAEADTEQPQLPFHPHAAHPDTPTFERLRFAAQCFKDVEASVTAARRSAEGEQTASSSALLSTSSSLPPLPSVPLAAPRPFLVQAPWFVPQSHRDQFFHTEVLRYLSHVAHPALSAFFAGEVMARVSGLDVGAGTAGQELYDVGGAKVRGNLTVLHEVVGAVERALKMLEASKEIKNEAAARGTSPTRASSLHSTLAALESLGARHDLVSLFSRFWETMESIGVSTDESLSLQRMRILSKAGNYEQIKTAFEAMHPDPSLNAHARQESPALLNPFALARRIKQDSGNTVFGTSTLPLDVVMVYSTALHAMRHVHRAEFANTIAQQTGEQSALMIERGASAAAVASSSAGLPVCPLPPALLSTRISSPFARYLRQYMLAPIIHSPSLWSYLNPTFFVQIMLALERQIGEEAHAQELRAQQAKLPSFARAREELQASSSIASISASNEEMWLIFVQLSALSAAEQSAPVAAEHLSPSDRGVGRRTHRFEAHRQMTLEFFCILLRNLHRAFNPQHLDEKGWGRAVAAGPAEERGDPVAKAAREEYHRRVEAVFDECLAIHGKRMREMMRATAAGRAALKTGLEDWTLLHDAPRAVMGPSPSAAGSGSPGVSTAEVGSATPITFVMLLNSYFDAMSRVPEGCASVERTFERFFTRQPAAQLKDAAMELKRKEMAPAFLISMQLQPNTHTMTSVLRCYLRSGVASDRVQAFLRGMLNRFKVSPTAQNYQSIMASVEELSERRWEEWQSAAAEPALGTAQPGLQALSLYREMLAKQMPPSPPFYLSLLRALATLHPSIPVPVTLPAPHATDAASSSVESPTLAPYALVERVLSELQEDRARREAAATQSSIAAPLDLALRVGHFEPLFVAYARAAEVAFADASPERIPELATLVGTLTQKSHRLLEYLFERGLGLGVSGQGHADTTTKQLVTNVHIVWGLRKLLVLRHALVQRLPPSHPMALSTPPLVPTLVTLQRSFLTKHSRKVMMAAGGPVEVMLRDAIHELHRLDRGSQGTLLSQSLASLASFLKEVLLVSVAPAEPLLSPTHYAQLMYLYMAFPALPPLVTGVASSVEDQWLPGWALFGRSQLERVTPSPRLVLSVFRMLQQAQQHSAALQLYSNMIFMDQIDMPSNVHAMVWPQVQHMATAAPSPSSASQDRLEFDAWLSSTSRTGLCMSSPWTLARSLMYTRFPTMSPLDLHSYWKVLASRAADAATAGDAAVDDGSNSLATATHERARLAHATPSEVIPFWERLLASRGLTPYLGRVAYVDLLALGSASGLGSDLEHLCVCEEDAAAESAALETREWSASRILPANPLDSPVSSGPSRALVSAHVSGVLHCCLESLRAKRRGHPDKAVPPILIRVGLGDGDAQLTDDQQLYLPRDLRALVSAQLQAIGLTHAGVQLNADQVHDQFKPFPASAQRKALPGHYLRVESNVIAAFLKATEKSTDARA